MKELLDKIRSRPLYYAALALCVAVFAVSAVMVAKEMYSQHRDDKQLIMIENSLVLPPEKQPTAAEVELPDTEAPALPVWHDIGALIGKNAEAVGWLQIPGTGVSYPVMFTPNMPEKYLRADFYGNPSRSGTPFIEASEMPDADNLLIYGHNMLTGTMFSDIEQYTEPSYAGAHPYLYWETAEGRYAYRIYAALYTDEKDAWYQKLNFADAADFDAAVKDMAARSEYRIGARPTFGQKLITLATCVGKKQEHRLLLIAVRED